MPEDSPRLPAQWPGYLWKGALAALVAVGAQWLLDLAFGLPAVPLTLLLGDFLADLACFALAQSLFPPFILRFKAIPTALAISLGAGAVAGYLVRFLYQLALGQAQFHGQALISLAVLAVMLGIITGLGWHYFEGRPAGFWGMFLAAAALITLFYFLTADPASRGDYAFKLLTLLAGFAPVIALIWWRHYPHGRSSRPTEHLDSD